MAQKDDGLFWYHSMILTGNSEAYDTTGKQTPLNPNHPAPQIPPWTLTNRPVKKFIA
jgi:hypothetical protein